MNRMLDIHGVTKRYGAVLACDDVSVAVGAGEVHGLLGQNGAGKSTLMKIVAGIVRPDHGEVRVDGNTLPPADPHAASAAGVGMVHQHFSLVEPLLVWENVTLGEAGRLSERESVARVTELGERYGLAVDPHARISDLAPGERQRVEIIKCLRRDPRVVILDEPTSVLTQTEAKRLFDVLGMLVRDEQRAVVLISHRLEEVLEVTERVTVLRDGRVVATLETAEADVNTLATEMLGRSVSLRREAAAIGLAVAGEEVWPAETADEAETTAAKAATAAPALEIEEATVRAPDGHRLLDELSLTMNAGEVLGVAGVEGNGQAALSDVIAGLQRLDGGTLRVGGKPIRTGGGRDPDAIGIVPADRHESGCVLQLSLAENLVLDRPEEVMRHGFLSRRLLRAHAERLVAEFAIATPSVDILVGALSGGNQQRVVLARELSRIPKVLVVSQPTQGLDVGAMEDIWTRLRAAAADGVAVLVISTDLDEIIALSDRVAVISRGRIVGEIAHGELDHDRLGLLMGGTAA